MKSIRWVSLVAAFCFTTTYSQVLDPTTGPASIDSGILASARALVTDWQPTPKDTLSTEWRRIQLGSNQITGQLELQTNHYTELANNLNFTNDFGALEASADIIMTNAGGAAALKGPTKVYFPPAIGGSGDPPIVIVSARNTVLKVHPLALYYFDAQSGKSVLLASAQHAQGEIVGLNQVVYRSVFPGCDIRLTYTKGAFESDLVMQARPRPPSAFGLSDDFTRIELWHGIDGPTPAQVSTVLDSITNPALRATMVEPDLTDETLDFADLHFPQSRGFSWNGLDEESTGVVPARVHVPHQQDNADEIVVAKRWGQIGQKAALMETVQWTNIAPSLAGLPLMAGGTTPSGKVQQASLKRQLPVQTKQAAIKTGPMKIAGSAYKAKGFVWDYTTVSSGTTYTFTGGSTFYISSPVSFSASVTFGAGCRIKYASGAYLEILSSGSIACSGNSSNPSVFTSKSDDTFGERITGSTGYPSYDASIALWLSSGMYPGQTLNYMTFRWAQKAVEYDVSGVNYFNNSSIQWCQTGLYINNNTVSFQNSTKCTVTTPTTGSGSWSTTGSLTDICNGTDVNGLSYSWEYEFLGTNGVNATADYDGDGLNNSQECASGTNPLVSDRPNIAPWYPSVTVPNRQLSNRLLGDWMSPERKRGPETSARCCF